MAFKLREIFDALFAADGTSIRIVGVPDLIAMKSLADRPRDREDITALRAILDEQSHQGGNPS